MNELRQLPNGWQWKKLKSIAKPPQYGWTTSAEQEGDYKLLRTTDITSGRLEWDTVPFCEEAPDQPAKYQLEENDIVISRAGSVGYSHLIEQPPDDAVFASYLIRFKPLLDHPKYIAYFLKSPEYWHAISEQKAGVAVQNVNATKLKEIDVPVAPPSEQRRIVAKIEELFSDLEAGVADLKKTQKQLQRYRQSVLQAAVEGRLTEDWRSNHLGGLEPADRLLERILEERRAQWEKDYRAKYEAKGKEPPSGWKSRYKPPEKPDAESLAAVPDEWVWANVDQVSKLISGQHIKTDNYNQKGEGIPYLTGPSDFGSKNPHVSKWTEHPKARADGGDVLVTVKGAGVGKTNLLDLDDTAISRQLMAISPHLIDSQFVYYFIVANFALFQRMGAGSTVPGINRSQMLSTHLPLPPLEEQHEIVNEVERLLSVADEATQTVEREIQRAERLRQSILKQAFSGKLVGQDEQAGTREEAGPPVASMEGEQIEMPL